MNTKNVAIKHISYVEGPNVLTSKEICERIKNVLSVIGAGDDFIEHITGIYERRCWNEKLYISDIATLSVKKLLEEYDIDKNEIGCLVNCSVGLDFGEPTVSIVVHNNLTMPNSCFTFDIANACIGFTNAIEIVSNMIKLGQIKYGIVFAGENSKNIIDLTIESINKPDCDFDRFQRSFAALTLGSGSVAMLLGPAEENDHIIDKTLLTTDSRFWHHCKGSLGRTSLDVDASNMLKSGVDILKYIEQRTLTDFPQFNDDNIDIYIPHQVSNRHNQVLCDTTFVNINKLYVTFPYLGNIGPASWPISLYLAVKEGKIKKGDYVGICSMGSGFNCGVTGIKW